ncbi:MAG: Leucine-rich repeat (LRR) protein [Bacteroidia bacterium]
MRIIFVIILFIFGFESCSRESVNRANEVKSNQIFTSEVDIIDSISVERQELGISNKLETKDSLFLTGVKSIPSGVFKRVDLKYLSVWGEYCDIYGVECFAISELPKKIEKLKNLEELRLTLNYIENFHPKS